ncbi:hypothetical protein Dvina_32780 [Dactylosporangium vinaceum]|uniref:Uncharacterized protein n=1 Tax=Dactylosporangium vinaceum TaxID=53362 RepID=A0ABV5MA98_9ACTN|nr:hypothetical protein [Dactylosporangium vinaceum]UAB93061.1 hypothetical protein Dvina_32780 [Dactylosporangium vinaceum]
MNPTPKLAPAGNPGAVRNVPSGNGIVLSLHYFDIPPDLPAPLESVPQLQAALARHTAAAGVGLVDCAVEPVDGVPAVRQLVKLRHPRGHGQVFIASCTVPRATCSTVLKLQAPERGMTGFREAIIMQRLLPTVRLDPRFKAEPAFA